MTNLQDILDKYDGEPVDDDSILIMNAARKWLEVEKAFAADIPLEDQIEWIIRIDE